MPIKLLKRSTCMGNMVFKVYYLMCKNFLLFVLKYWRDPSSSLFHAEALWFSTCILGLLLLNPCSSPWASSPPWPPLTGCILLPGCSGPQVPTINATSSTQVSALQVELGRTHIPIKFLHSILCTYTQLSTWSQILEWQLKLTSRNYSVGGEKLKHSAEWRCDHNSKKKPPRTEPLTGSLIEEYPNA